MIVARGMSTFVICEYGSWLQHSPYRLFADNHMRHLNTHEHAHKPSVAHFQPKVMFSLTHTHTYEPSTAIRSSQNTNSQKRKSLNITCPSFCQTFRFISRVSLISTRNIFFLRVMVFFSFFFINCLNSSVLPSTSGSFLRFIYPENETQPLAQNLAIFDILAQKCIHDIL